MSHQARENDGYVEEEELTGKGIGSPASDCSRLPDTPETDQAEKDYFDDPFGSRAERDLFAFVRHMERDRDDARAEAMLWRERWADDTPLEEIPCTLPPWMRKKNAPKPETVRSGDRTGAPSAENGKCPATERSDVGSD